jgi:hypothetical protein
VKIKDSINIKEECYNKTRGGLRMKRHITARHKAGLHKDVCVIFEKAKDFALENIQYSDQTESASLKIQGKTDKYISESPANRLGQVWSKWPLMPPQKKKKQKIPFSFAKFFRLSK